ncbi:MAG TPA: hypothetical protein V6D25_06795 [Leptolyngbyaceae cyanobacterium]
MVDLYNHLLADLRKHNPAFGILDLKTCYRGFRYIREMLKTLSQKPEPVLLA